MVYINLPEICPVHGDGSLDDELGAAAGGSVPKRHVVALLQADDSSHLLDYARKHIQGRGRS